MRMPFIVWLNKANFLLLTFKEKGEGGKYVNNS